MPTIPTTKGRYLLNIVLKDTRNGFTAVIPFDYDYDPTDGHWLYWWTDGNMACDCNRSAEIAIAGDPLDELGCNSGDNVIIIEKVVNRLTGEEYSFESFFA